MNTAVIEKQNECSMCLYKGEIRLASKEESIPVCRKYPPIPMSVGNGIVTIYPTISNESWCGEFYEGVGPTTAPVLDVDCSNISSNKNIVNMFPNK